MDILNNKKTTSTLKQAHRAIRKKMLGYVAAGLGLVAGLAWNEAIKLVIDRLIPTGSTIIAKVLYAVAVTLLVGLILFYVEKSLDENKN